MSPSLPSLKDAGLDTYCLAHRGSHTAQSIEPRLPELSSGYNSSASYVAQHQARKYPSKPDSTNANSTQLYPLYSSSIETTSRHGSVSTASESTWAYSTTPSPMVSYATPSSSDTNDIRKGRKGRNGRKGGRGKNDAKNGKEKRQRAELSGIFQIHQDVLEMYCGSVHGIGQSAGNAKTSGLGKKKIDGELAFITVLLHFFDAAFKEALRTGKVEEFEAKCHRLQTECLDRDSKDPTVGTLMYGTGRSCRRGEHEICATHGEMNWIECRITRVKENFEKNVALFLEECERRMA